MATRTLLVRHQGFRLRPPLAGDRLAGLAPWRPCGPTRATTRSLPRPEARQPSSDTGLRCRADVAARTARRLAVRSDASSRPRTATKGHESRAGGYWNLVAPYAFASGPFPLPLLGRTAFCATCSCTDRAYSGSFVPAPTRSTVDAGLSDVGCQSGARTNAVIPADNDRPDRLVLSLYGQLAAGMAREPSSRARDFPSHGCAASPTA